MSYFRISTVSASVNLADLGYTVTHPAVNEILSNQFSVTDLTNSSDLVAAVIAGSITAQVNLDGTWTSVVAGSFSSDEIVAAHENIWEIVNTSNNQELVNNSDTSLHNHDTMYYTKTQIGQVAGATGSDLLGDDDNYTNLNPSTTTQKAFNESVDAKFGSFDLDTAYDNDTDGILNVDGVTKPLILRSNDVNDVVIDRKLVSDIQDVLRADVSADELLLGSAAVGALAKVTVRVLTDLVVDGNFTFTGTVTDTTVNNLNVTNANITLREGAVTDADASFAVNLPVGGIDADLLWDNTSARWKAGLIGTEKTIALLEASEIVTGVWDFQGASSTNPNMYFTNKAAAPTVALGAAGQVPLSVINNIPAYYDKTNSRNKWLSMYRETFFFTGRDSANNSNEYASTVGAFKSNNSGIRLSVPMTLLSISVQTTGAETWIAEVRKNNSATVLASLSVTAAAGDQVTTLNVDFVAGDDIQVYINGTSVDRPSIKLVFAEKL